MKRFLLKMALIPALLGISATASANYGGYPCGSCGPCNTGCNNVFDGFYVGANVGFASFHHEFVDLNGYFTPLVLQSFSADGNNYPRTNTRWTAGFQLGFDWLCCSKLFGVVWDWNWTGAETKTDFDTTVLGIGIVARNSIHHKLRWFSTIRARFGAVICNEVLIYLTAGGAVAHTEHRVSKNEPTFFNISQTSSAKHHRWGWTAGVGTEFAVWCNWTVNAEILYMRFDTKRISINTNNFGTPVAIGLLTRANFDFNNDVWVGRVGFNYRFSLCDWFR